MRKIYTFITVIATVTLLATTIPSNVDASASMGGNGQSQPQTGQEQSWNNYDNHDFGSKLHRYFHRWNGGWHHHDSGNHSQAPEQQASPDSDDQQAVTPDNGDQNAKPETPEVDEEQENNQDQTDNSELNQFEQQVVDLTNKERQNNGLQPLKVDTELSKVAREKSRDMQQKNYFDHNSPTYGSPFDMMDAFNINYQAAGENIAKGQTSPEEVVDAWMNSQGHRENILNPSFTHIGVGFIDQGNVWTQQFIGK